MSNKLATLRRKAQATTAARGHRMRWGEVYGRADGPQSQIGRCLDCGREVQITEHPAPNGADISGETVALECAQ